MHTKHQKFTYHTYSRVLISLANIMLLPVVLLLWALKPLQYMDMHTLPLPVHVLSLPVCKKFMTDFEKFRGGNTLLCGDFHETLLAKDGHYQHCMLRPPYVVNHKTDWNLKVFQWYSCKYVWLHMFSALQVLKNICM